MARQKNATNKLELPAGTPTWSVGWTVLLVSVLTVLVTFYLAIKPEVESYLESSQSMQKQQMELEFKKFELEVTSRVSHLERDVKELQLKLQDCQTRLKECSKQ